MRVLALDRMLFLDLARGNLRDELGALIRIARAFGFA